MSSAAEEIGAADTARSRTATLVQRSLWNDARYQAFVLLRLAFTVAPIAFGLDKFWNQMVYWPKYLAPWINHLMPGCPAQGSSSCMPSASSRSSPASSSC